MKGSNGLEMEALYKEYGIQTLVLRRREHHSCVMYRLSKRNNNLELSRSNSKVKQRKRKI